jgi:hypothetical protein
MMGLRDSVLGVYAWLKREIDDGFIVDAFVTDAYTDDKGNHHITTKVSMPAAIREINISVDLTL